MNVGYGLALHEFSEAQVDRAATRCLEGHRLIFSLSLPRDMLINSFSQLFHEA